MFPWFTQSWKSASDAYTRQIELSLTCAEIMSRRSFILLEYACTGNAAHLRELEQMVGEKMAVLPEIGFAMGQECIKQVFNVENDALKMMEASLDPIHKRTNANLKRLRKKK